MISHAEALALVHAHVATLTSESVASADAEGRVLAEVLSSPAELPPFDNSAMDGFALATAGTGALADSEHVVSGTVAAGQDVGAAATGTAWEIMTGAGVPASADAVVPIEQVQILERDGERPSRIRLRQPVRAGQHIRRRGEDVCLHDRVIEAGTVLRGAHLMLLAGLGCARVQVMRRPRVALIATGRELIGDPAQALQPGQIRDGTSSYLLSQLRAAGADVVWRGRVGDDDAAFDAALAQACTAGADLILSTGAVSRGRYDFIPDALALTLPRCCFTTWRCGRASRCCWHAWVMVRCISACPVIRWPVQPGCAFSSSRHCVVCWACRSSMAYASRWKRRCRRGRSGGNICAHGCCAARQGSCRCRSCRSKNPFGWRRCCRLTFGQCWSRRRKALHRACTQRSLAWAICSRLRRPSRCDHAFACHGTLGGRMTTMRAWTGVVLAGGRSSRMGQDKALLQWHGRPLVEQMQALLREAGAQHVLVSGDRPDYAGIADAQPDLGPLGGLASVVARVADATTLVLVPVDMPLLSVALLGRLLAPSQHRCVAFEDQMLPMCLCIDTGVREALTALMAGPASSRSLRALQHALQCHRVAVTASERGAFVNCNTPEQWSELIHENPD